MDKTYTIKGSTVTAIADAIRAKSGTTDQMRASEMAQAIAEIETGGGEEGWSVVLEETECTITSLFGGEPIPADLTVGPFDTSAKYRVTLWAEPYGGDGVTSNTIATITPCTSSDGNTLYVCACPGESFTTGGISTTDGIITFIITAGNPGSITFEIGYEMGYDVKVKIEVATA